MKTSIVALAAVVLCGSASAVEHNGWVKHAGNPVLGSPELGTCFDINVVGWGTAKYNSYFSWRPQKCIALARSEDGIVWSEPVRCLEADPESGWEDNLNRATVWFKDGTYHMWYTGQANGYSKIGYATSTDGVRFTRVSRLPVLIPDHPWEGFSVMNPYVRWDAARNVWRMWYASGETFEPNVICYAESRDGLAWTKSLVNPVLTKSANWYERDRVGGCEVHPLPDGRWVMFYIGYSDIHTARVCAAVSANGVTGWKRLQANPLVSPTAGGWDASACYKPSVVRDEEHGRWLLWYNGRHDHREYFGLVTHEGLELGPVQRPFASVLDEEIVRRHVDRFNLDDDELYANAISNRQSFWRLKEIVPRFECPDEELVRTYYFRWWTYRKHLRKSDAGWVVTEFLPSVTWAGYGNTISCPYGHHILEGRWLRDPAYLDDYERIMIEKGTVNGPRAYAAWPARVALDRARVTGDLSGAKSRLAAYVRNYEVWEKGWTVRGASLQDVKAADTFDGPQIKTGFRAERGLFDFAGDREGSEFALSADGARPMVNAAMWAEATAIAELASACGDEARAKAFSAKAAALAASIRKRLWNPAKQFFCALGVDGRPDDVRELHGYAPFYFGMDTAGCEAAWKALVDPRGFRAPKGLTYPAQDTPGFDLRIDVRKHACLWNGPSWPYATSVALTALYRALQGEGAASLPVRAEDFAALLAQYARQQRLTRDDGRTVPWIDENIEPFTGEWVARKVLAERRKADPKRSKYVERGKDYNHSTFCDLVIAGLCGFVPQKDGAVVIRPLAPAAWDWWCVDGIRYHGHDMAVLFDRTGQRYKRGKGLIVLKDGEAIPFAGGGALNDGSEG